MNLQQFAKLAAGDKIQNTMLGSQGHGEIVEADASGVKVVWGERHPQERHFHFGVNSTAWFHWTKLEDVREPRPTDEGSGGNV